MQLARLISSQCKGQMVNHWSPDQLQVTWPPSVLMYFFSSWTVFFTIYPMQFLSWLDNIALWHSIFSPSDLHQEGWCPTDHLISTSAKPLGHTQFFQKYFLQFSKCISQYQPNAFLLLINFQIHLTHLPGRSFTWSADFPPGSNIWLFRADKYQPIMFVCHPGSR